MAHPDSGSLTRLECPQCQWRRYLSDAASAEEHCPECGGELSSVFFSNGTGGRSVGWKLPVIVGLSITACLAIPIVWKTNGGVEPRSGRKATQNNGVVCDQFDVIAKVNGGIAEVRLQTDLPDFTNVIVSVSRCHQDKGNPGVQYPINYFSESSTVGEWRARRTIPVPDKLFLDGLQKQKDRLAKLGEPFEVETIADTIDVGFTVHLRQTNPVFGPENANLTGRKVDVTRHVVREEVAIQCPLQRSEAGNASHTTGKPAGDEQPAPLVIVPRAHFADNDAFRARAEQRLQGQQSARVQVRGTDDITARTHAQSQAEISSAKPHGSTERYYRDSQGVIASETKIENDLEGLRNKIRSMPDNGYRAYLQGVLRALEEEWVRMKRNGPVEPPSGRDGNGKETSAGESALSESMRRQIFFELVKAQDAGVGIRESYTVIARKYGLPERMLSDIAYEGAAKKWPKP
jgi:ribosomal protein S27E